ncbi:MAG: hypothetical protein AAGD05_19230, partial [Bacteroidota bacterium]
PIADWKKSSLEKEILSLQAQQLQHTEATFDFNMDAQVANYQAEIQRLQAQLVHDQKIVQLQADLLEQLAAQLDEGVITSVDYLSQVNAELTARQNLLIHQTQLHQTQLEFWNERGAF